MNTDGEIITSKHNRTRQKKKSPEESPPSLDITFKPPIENIVNALNSEESTSGSFLSEFPELPNRTNNIAGNEPFHFGISVPYSKILVKKPEVQFSNSIHVVPCVQETKSTSKNQVPKKNPKPNHVGESRLSLSKNNIQSANVEGNYQSVSPQKLSNVRPSTNQESVGTQIPLQVTICSQETMQVPVKQKRKRKRRPKKALTIQQGKVLMLTQEQYMAITEPNQHTSKPATRNLNISDENEYPEIGIPKDISLKAERKNKYKSAGSHDRIKNEDQENIFSNVPSGPSKGNRPTAKNDGKKFKAPIEMNILDMLLTVKKPEKKAQKFQTLNVKREKVKIAGRIGAPNALDSSGPIKKRGKEREAPKKPKISKLKKIILKERTEKQLSRVLKLEVVKPDSTNAGVSKQDEIVMKTEHQPPVDVLLENIQHKSENLKDEHVSLETCNEFHLTENGNQKEIKTEIATESNVHLKCAKRLLHCRKFREYCYQFISEDIDALTFKFLEELVRFQDRLYLKDPIKAKSKRRLICGLREVTKNLKLRKLKLVIMAPDIEEIESTGGLNDALQSILKFSSDFYTPMIFSLPRRKLGKACKKKSPVCCIGIINYEGAEEMYKNLMELVVEARKVYKETLENVQQNLTPEIIEILGQDNVNHMLVENVKRSYWGSQTIKG